MNFEQWYKSWADPNVGLVEDIPKRQGAKVAWDFQQARIAAFEEELALLNKQYKILDESCQQWHRRYIAEAKKVAVLEAEAGNLKRENESLRTSNEQISTHNGNLQDALERQSKIIWPNRTGEDTDLVQQARKAIASDQYYGAILANSAQKAQPTDPDALIRECAAFAKAKGVLVSVFVDGVAFTINGAP